MDFLKKALSKAKGAIDRMKSRFDRQGSYTGTPEKGKQPEQDADDL